MRTPGLRESLYLVSKGVPYEIAMRMSPARRLAFAIAFGENDGGSYNWNTMRWREKK